MDGGKGIYVGGTLISILISLALYFTGKRETAIFVGLWAPTILNLGQSLLDEDQILRSPPPDRHLRKFDHHEADLARVSKEISYAQRHQVRRAKGDVEDSKRTSAPLMHWTNDHPVADAVTSVAEGRTPLLEEPEAFVLSRLQGAGVRMAKRRFEAGEAIYLCGDPDRYLYFLTEGVLKLYKPYRRHKEAIVTLLEKNSDFGEPAPHVRGAHRDSAEAVVACRVAAVDKAALEYHLRRDPRCALALLMAYSQQVQRRERATARLIPREIRPRLVASLLELSNRFGEPTEGEVLIGVHLTHRMLAAMTASSRVGVSQEMARFCREGLIGIRRKGQIVLLDEPRMAEMIRSPQFRKHYSLECLEEKFREVRLEGVLGSSSLELKEAASR